MHGAPCWNVFHHDNLPVWALPVETISFCKPPWGLKALIVLVAYATLAPTSELASTPPTVVVLVSDLDGRRSIASPTSDWMLEGRRATGDNHGRRHKILNAILTRMLKLREREGFEVQPVVGNLVCCPKVRCAVLHSVQRVFRAEALRRSLLFCNGARLRDAHSLGARATPAGFGLTAGFGCAGHGSATFASIPQERTVRGWDVLRGQRG